jgi:hypothetical protein
MVLFIPIFASEIAEYKPAKPHPTIPNLGLFIRVPIYNF